MPKKFSQIRNNTIVQPTMGDVTTRAKKTAPPGKRLQQRVQIPAAPHTTKPSAAFSESLKEDGAGPGFGGGAAPGMSTASVPTTQDPNVGYAFKKLRQKNNKVLRRKKPVL